MDGRTDVVMLPMASGIGLEFRVVFGVVTRGGALIRLGRRGAERWNWSCAASDVQQHQRQMDMRVLMKPHC
jgi:hypothetical protein